ncbi:hypothetical protein LXL04_024302 [Taraxacum kok-saghyz]
MGRRKRICIITTDIPTEGGQSNEGQSTENKINGETSEHSATDIPSEGAQKKRVHGYTRKTETWNMSNSHKILTSLQAISSESSSSTQGSVSNFSNDDYSQVKGPEKRGYIRCVGRMPTIKKVASSTRNPDPAVEELKAMPGSTSSVESHHNGNKFHLLSSSICCYLFISIF